MTKKIALAFLALTTASFAVAGPALNEAIRNLNAEIVKLLAPIQNPDTKAEIAFEEILTDANHALKVKASAAYSKSGSYTSFNLNVNEISYDYNNGADPLTILAGSIGVDLTKFYSVQDLNTIANDVEGFVKEFSQEYTAEYGAAVTVVADITDKKMDAAGNVQSIAGRISFDIDLSKLPANKPVNLVMFKSGRADFDLNVTTGAKLSIKVVSNVLYHGFQNEEAGLKEYLDSLLNLDPQLLRQLQELAVGLDSAAGDWVNKQP